jgi:hypothetical protein
MLFPVKFGKWANMEMQKIIIEELDEDKRN